MPGTVPDIETSVNKTQSHSPQETYFLVHKNVNDIRCQASPMKKNKQNKEMEDNKGYFKVGCSV